MDSNHLFSRERGKVKEIYAILQGNEIKQNKTPKKPTKPINQLRNKRKKKPPTPYFPSNIYVKKGSYCECM